MSKEYRPVKFSFPYPIHPITNAAAQIFQGEDPWFALGCFLHDWWTHTNDERPDLIATPPPPAITFEEKRWAAFCAAVVEELCLRTSLSSPAWTEQQDFFLPDPWFYDSQPSPSQREWLLSTTPESFKRRNIFVGGNVLDNKYELKDQFKARPAWEIWSDEELQQFSEGV
jgi:hypothetical protein